MDLSLPAEVLLLAVDPGRGGLLAKRGRLRDAIRAAGKVDGSSGSVRRARRELLDAGLIELHGPRRTPHLTDRTVPAKRFNAIKRASARGELDDERDQQVFVLLAGSGVLARRLDREEQRIARRRLSALIPEPNASTAGLAPGLLALVVLGDHGFGGFDSGGADSGGGDSGGGGEGGFDAGGGEGGGQ